MHVMISVLCLAFAIFMQVSHELGTLVAGVAIGALVFRSRLGRKYTPPICFYNPSKPISVMSLDELFQIAKTIQQETDERIVGFSLLPDSETGVRIEVLL